MRDGTTLEFKWTISRGRDTYGYNICSLYVDGRKTSSCNGGGYDMKGTALGNWVAREFAPELLALTPEQMPAQSHWQPEHTRVCAGECDEKLRHEYINAVANESETPEPVLLSEDTWECPTCKGPTRSSNRGERVDDGRYFYGLTFHDPNFDPSKAVIGDDCTDRTLGDGAEGKTVAEAEAAGESFGLERYQAFYQASAKQPTPRHTVPLIDGACGFSSVETILKAIGYQLEWVKTRSKNLEIYTLRKVEISQVGD